MSNPLRYLKEKIISKLSLESKEDIPRLTVTANVFEQITFSTLKWMFDYDIDPEADDPLKFNELVDLVLTMRVTERGRSRKDIKDVYTFREHYSDIKQPVTTQKPEEKIEPRRRRWL